MKIWVDDIRIAPNGYIQCKSVNEAKSFILQYVHRPDDATLLLDLDHDLGDYYCDDGDGIKLLDWLEEINIVNSLFVFRLHTANPVGAENMRRIIQKNCWNLSY